MQKMDEKMQKTIIRLIKLFVEERYSEIADWSNNIRMTADEMKEEVDDYAYGQKVIFPTANFLNDVDIMGIVDTNDGRKRWSVIFELWMDKEGKSDLSVELFFINSSEEYYDIEINNIHMM